MPFLRRVQNVDPAFPRPSPTRSLSRVASLSKPQAAGDGRCPRGAVLLAAVALVVALLAGFGHAQDMSAFKRLAEELRVGGSPPPGLPASKPVSSSSSSRPDDTPSTYKPCTAGQTPAKVIIDRWVVTASLLFNYQLLFITF